MEQCTRVLVALFALILSACGAGGLESERDTAEAYRHETTIALDRGEWDRAISRLEDARATFAFAEDERRLNLAAAYAGKAGYDLHRIVEILTDPVAPPQQTGRQLIRAFARMRPSWDSMTHLEQARLHYASMLAHYPGGIREACKEENRHLLDSLQLDACFYYGTMALVRAAVAIALVLPEDLDTWLAERSLDCRHDRNDNGLLDSVEALACGLYLGRDFDDAGSCLTTLNGEATVSWQRRRQYEPLGFYHDGLERAELIPVRIEIAAAGSCAGQEPHRHYLLWQRRDRRVDQALTSGYCHSHALNTRADAAEPAAQRWPCPVLRPAGKGALTLSESLLNSLNEDAETLFALLPQGIRTAIPNRAADFRAEICEAVREVADACERSPSGHLQVNEAALADYLHTLIEL